jgi:alkanesulfonate monooxygenase SsuD/methylene tetrahydromethanopterin reductase-like flavin-dependent oxidoreductase (luciferase family)
MEFNHFLSSYLPDPAYGGKRLLDDMVEQARLADRLGYRGVTIPEHHLINILLIPSPLQMAVKVAAETKHLELMTSVVVLPIHDMRVLAGEVAQADILCDGRLVLGVGRGAFAYEMGRMGVPIETSRAKFEESLEVLTALLTREEVSWDGEFYKFEPLTTMPRPMTQPMPPLMIAVMVPEGIYACAKRGFHIQTTPLQGSHEKLLQQVGAFKRAKEELGDAGDHLRLSLSRVMYAARDGADAREKIALAYGYYSRFDNVFTGPGIVENGAIAPLPRAQTIEELAENLIICPPTEMVDRLAAYAEAGIDEVIVSSNIGQSQDESLEAMQRLAEEVMPQFTRPSRATAVAR